MVCIFSPQKQMGRPKKRRREGEVGEATKLQQNACCTITTIDDPSTYNDFGIITPPQFQESSSFVNDMGFADANTLSQHMGSMDASGLSPISNIDLQRDPAIDPSLWDDSFLPAPIVDQPGQETLAPCTCLAAMYLTISELQSVQSFHFPQVVIPLRKAMGVLSDLIHCPQCPKDNFSAIQNVASIAALCKAIVERFNKVLLVIDAEAERLEQTGEKKPYRIGDNSAALQRLHTGTLDCPLGFDIEIGAQDYKRIAKMALKTEVYGNGSNPRPLLQLIKEAEDRQQRWHEDAEMNCVEREHMFGKQTPEGAKKSCHALGSEHIRMMIDRLKWE
ncbi:hypothetical protein HBI72_002650 [Parastagonospora nodorum]|nr:hypothetical protein HBI72_002650 [Parastagonospora nodorum]